MASTPAPQTERGNSSSRQATLLAFAGAKLMRILSETETLTRPWHIDKLLCRSVRARVSREGAHHLRDLSQHLRRWHINKLLVDPLLCTFLREESFLPQTRCCTRPVGNKLATLPISETSSKIWGARQRPFPLRQPLLVHCLPSSPHQVVASVSSAEILTWCPSGPPCSGLHTLSRAARWHSCLRTACPVDLLP